ncbi:hypothetical protein TrLO_g14896 [Triparma laevis f. longispina]|uniref:RanBD1 domain-containing protein n=1 Tax=Triparma laevis f. longispina TaxID=1714387 RepID=A0A9W7L132_9STRA|nr:hypothetical protein TrLO_g14896 [Triparma laevis f. longispina]
MSSAKRQRSPSSSPADAKKKKVQRSAQEAPSPLTDPPKDDEKTKSEGAVVDPTAPKNSATNAPAVPSPTATAPSSPLKTSVFNSIFDTGGGFSTMAKQNTTNNSTTAPQTATTTAATSSATTTAFESSGFATFNSGSNPFKIAVAKAGSNSSGFGFGKPPPTPSTTELSSDNKDDKDKDKSTPAASSSAFGTSGFASFSKSNPFATALASTGNRSGFGSGFGNPPPASDPSPPDTTSKGGSSTPKDETGLSTTSETPPTTKTEAETSSSDPPPAKPPTPPLDAPADPTTNGPPPSNGEESEQCVLQLRIKTFRLTTSRDVSSSSAPKKFGEWKEMGIGPIRVLQPTVDTVTTHVRLVQRRETTPGGQGTKVLLNTQITTCELSPSFSPPPPPPSTSTGKIFKPEGKFIRIGAPTQEGDTVTFETYLCKFKNEADRELFSNVVADCCGYTKV